MSAFRVLRRFRDMLDVDWASFADEDVPQYDAGTGKLVGVPMSGGGGSSDAADIDIVDAGSYFTGTDVETALQELGADVGSLPDDFAAILITNTGPNSGLDDNIPLVAGDPAISDWLTGMVGNSAFGIPITIGANGGFTVDCKVPKAFALAHPAMNIYFELAMSNADGTEKLGIGLNANIPFDTSGTYATPDYTGATYWTVEQIGADLSQSTIVPGFPMAIKSAAGGQYFVNLFTQIGLT